MNHVSPFRKRILSILSIFNTIILLVISVLFVVFIIQGIPLKYLLGFIVLYVITLTLSFLLDTSKIAPTGKQKSPVSQHSIWYSIVGVNIFILLLVSLLIFQYELDAYILEILLSVIIVLNPLLLGYYLPSARSYMRGLLSSWVLRTFFLIMITGVAVFAWNSFTDIPPLEIDAPLKKTSSEVTGVLSTIDPTTLTPAKQKDPIESQEGKIIEKNPPQTEATGTLTTPSPSDTGIRIDSIESIDGRATASVQDGKLTINVTPSLDTIGVATEQPNTSENWKIRSSIKNNGGAGGLQGVVISAPMSSPRGGAYDQYQSITLSAEGASGIFFTIDGSEPSCDGKGKTELETPEKEFTLKAISCFGGNKIRGPISVHTFGVK